MPRLGLVVCILSMTLGALVGCGGSAPPEDPASVDTSAPVAPGEPSSAGDASKPSGEPSGTGATPAPSSEKEGQKPASPPEPAREAEPAAPPPSSPAAPAAPALTGGGVEGTIAARKGPVLVINTSKSPAPGAGSKGSLFLYFEQKVGPFNTSGWLGIADVTVKTANEGRLELTIDAEKSVIVVDGKKVDHFAPGNRVKLEPAK